jgi:hypothetical protein
MRTSRKERELSLLNLEKRRPRLQPRNLGANQQMRTLYLTPYRRVYRYPLMVMLEQSCTA